MNLQLYIARDENGSLNLFHCKPRLAKMERSRKKHWVTPLWGSIPISAKLFPEVTFESSPVVVESLNVKKL